MSGVEVSHLQVNGLQIVGYDFVVAHNSLPEVEADVDGVTVARVGDGCDIRWCSDKCFMHLWVQRWLGLDHDGRRVSG